MLNLNFRINWLANLLIFRQLRKTGRISVLLHIIRKNIDYPFIPRLKSGDIASLSRRMASVGEVDLSLSLPINPDKMIEKRLKAATSEIIKKLYNQEIRPEAIGLEKTKKEIEGDFTIVVFPISKISKKSPEVTANEIGIELERTLPEIKKFSVIKGFLNIILKDHFWLEFILNNYNNPSFGIHEERNEAPLLVEFSSPNTNKPLHLGHIRNNLLGFSVSKILQANGNKVIRMNLVNDRGIHICKSMVAYRRWGNGETPESTGMKSDHMIGKYYVLFDQKYKEEIRQLVSEGVSAEEAEKTAPLILEAQEVLRKWESHDEEILQLWKRMNNWAYKGFEETYHNLGITFDKIEYESQTYLQGKELVKGALKKGLLNEKEDGSIWADLTEEGLDEKLLLRGDGTSVYMTQDLGTAWLRNRDYSPSGMVYVVGNEQNYHFDVLQRILKKMGNDWAGKIYHLSYGMVELPEGKMKSREGTVVDADDLMKEMISTAAETTRELGKLQDFTSEESSNLFRIIGLGALKYFILKVDPKKNMLFDPKESIDFNGNTGPFIQYTFARIKSLLRKAGSQGFTLKDVQISERSSFDFLDQEREIIRILHQFPSVVETAAKDYNPSEIANYVYELAREYNQFYQEVPVLKEESLDKIIARLILSSFAGSVISKSMELLGIEVPERM